jgi:hypothetical protein
MPKIRRDRMRPLRNLTIFDPKKEDDEITRRFWKNKSPDERLSAVEFLREQYYVIQGYKEPPSIIRELHVVEG